MSTDTIDPSELRDALNSETIRANAAEKKLAEMTATAKRLAEALVSLNRTTRSLLAVDAIPKAQDDAWAEYGHDSYPKTTAAILEAREKGLL